MAAESVAPVSLLKADDLFQATVLRNPDVWLLSMSSHQPILRENTQSGFLSIPKFKDSFGVVSRASKVAVTVKLQLPKKKNSR